MLRKQQVLNQYILTKQQVLESMQCLMNVYSVPSNIELSQV